MFASQVCELPGSINKYLQFFKNNEINCCISGGYTVYRIGFSNYYTDVDIFVNSFNFDEKLFLESHDNIIELVLDDSYVIGTPIMKRFHTTVESDEKPDIVYTIDFVLMECNKHHENDYLFSEFITSRFDLDICRLSIVNVNKQYRIVFNANFKLFIRNDKKNFKNNFEVADTKAYQRFLKYEARLKIPYLMVFSNNAPAFDYPVDINNLLKYQQLNIEWYELKIRATATCNELTSYFFRSGLHNLQSFYWQPHRSESFYEFFF